MSSLSLVFIWLDRRSGNLPGGNQKLKEKFRKLLSPIRQFDKPNSCLDSIELSLKDKCVFFLTSDSFADEEFLKKIASIPNIYRIYIYDQQGNGYQFDDANLIKKLGSERIIQFDEQLYKQILLDLIKIYSKESDQAGQGKQAKELLESAVKLINTIDDKDEDLQQLEKYLLTRIGYLK
ncbi:unnamed protein product [Rotaria magnacalcarata]|uniref:Uncharacterized protein n=2 Tax=Rotaria magnacalcarata TaxID=392030 RepID=A0A819RJZ2_9BILA|nr:unnamed protein product [Rotaria magnacalcarata]CAF4048365.1 unnamed protein product [Rotaria magnacalcarata]